jgi:hypothetical protein
VALVGIALLVNLRPAEAQDLRRRDPSADEIKKVEDELAQMRRQLERIEDKLDRPKPPTATFNHGTFPPFGGSLVQHSRTFHGPQQRGGFTAWGRGPGFPKYGVRSHQASFQVGGFWAMQHRGPAFGGSFGSQPRATQQINEIDKKLDQLIHNVERLTRVPPQRR